MEKPKCAGFSSRARSPLSLSVQEPEERALRQGAQRLATAIADLPLRYAPFFGRLAVLWGTTEDHVLAELARAKAPGSWSLTLLRGLQTFEIDLGSARRQERARLLRFEPGSRFPQHRHRGTEHALVLEGVFADATGSRTHAGQERTMLEGSEHELYIIGRERCVTAVSERGIDFTGPILRWTNKLRP